MGSRKFSVLISKENSPPYYIQIPLWVRNFILYIFPVLFLLGLIILAINISLFKFGKVVPEVGKDKEKIQLKKNNQELENQISALEKQNQKLRTQVLTLGTNPPTESEAFRYNFIKFPQTFKDLSSKKKITFSKWQWDYSSNKAKLTFRLDNKSNEKLRGFLFVVQYTHNSYQIFPFSNHPEVLFQKSYLEGDSFNISYYKPVQIEFDLPSKTKVVNYMLLALSIDGDLLLEKQYGPYQL